LAWLLPGCKGARTIFFLTDEGLFDQVPKWKTVIGLANVQRIIRQTNGDA
jgi:hypothetical protein